METTPTQQPGAADALNSSGVNLEKLRQALAAIRPHPTLYGAVEGGAAVWEIFDPIPEHRRPTLMGATLLGYRSRDAEVAELRAEVEKLKEFAEMIEWLEAESKASPTGISFDYCRHAEEGRVVEKGYRFMRKHFLGDRADTLVKAIKLARKALTPEAP